MKRLSRAPSMVVLSLAISFLFRSAELSGQSAQRLFPVRLEALDATSGDLFGCALAADGGTIVVGSFVDDRGPDSGAFYLYQIDDGVWRQRHKMAGSDTEAGDHFGYSVAVSETRVDGVFVDATPLVGAPFADAGGTDSGAAYVFVMEDGVLQQEAKLTASDATTGDLLGAAVAIDDGRAVVGAPGRDHWQRGDAGGVYVFERGVRGWSQRAILRPHDLDTGDRFGRSVALVGGLAVAGAPFDDDRVIDSGSVYVFRRLGGEWFQEAKLAAPDAVPFAAFGYVVATDGQRIVVGAPRYGAGGAAFVFRANADGWELDTRLDPPPAATGGQFGVSVATDSGMVLVGSRLADDAAPDAGAASLFRRTAGGWAEINRLVASDASAGDELGLGVALSGPTAVAGAYLNDVAGDNAGSAYLLAPSANLSLQLTSRFDPVRRPACRSARRAVARGDLVPGCGVEYTLTVSNNGPDDVSGVEVTFPVSGGVVSPLRAAAALQAQGENVVTLPRATWTCSATAGASCRDSGVGDIDDAVILPAGGRLTYRVMARIPPQARGNLNRSASFQLPVGVLNATEAESVAADSRPLTPVVDTSVELSHSLDPDDTPGCVSAAESIRAGEVVPGCRVIYSLEARNDGASQIDNVEVRTETPPNLLSELTWQCTATRGGACEPTGGGTNLDALARLPPGAKVTYRLAATVDGSARGELRTTALVDLPPGVIDLGVGSDPEVDPAPLRPVVTAVAAGGQKPTSPTRLQFFVFNCGPSDLSHQPPDDLRIVAQLPPLFYPGECSLSSNDEDDKCQWTCTKTGKARCTERMPAGDLVDANAFLPATSSGPCTTNESSRSNDDPMENDHYLTYTLDDMVALQVKFAPTPPVACIVLAKPEEVTGDGISSTMQVRGDLREGGTVFYTVRIENHLGRTQFNNPQYKAFPDGNEFYIDLSGGDRTNPQLRLIGAQCGQSSGNVCENKDLHSDLSANTVSWNGSMCPGAVVELTIEATVNATPETKISPQGRIHYDSEGDGTNNKKTTVSAEFEVKETDS